ncbi:MAG: vitamin B12-dependent ribonucleotide reductase [Thermoguttaceae bacterium]|jgi:ribonucleoside-diphosphate reductase alpha chain
MDKPENETLAASALLTDHPAQKPARAIPCGLTIKSIFCPENIADPFSTVQWERRCAQIKGEGGEIFFEQLDCEIPATWSQLATNVVASKYLYGEVGTPERETGVRQLIHRVCRTISDWGIADGYFASKADGERFYRDLVCLCLHQYASFNSPVWFNVGLYHQYGIKGAMCNWAWDAARQEIAQPENPYEYPQGSACFIQSVRDDMEDIMELARSEAMLFKFGSGTGTDISTLRSHRERLSGGGRPSGPLSFMRVYDQIAAVVKSGGKTRRAAKMQSIKDWHPDVMEFIECKCREEKKVRLLIEQGYDPLEAYDSVLFQNANLSLRVSDEFMRAVEEDKPWTTHWVTDPAKAGPTYSAREMFQKMAQSAWSCGDPGVQYDTTINRWHTCPNSGRINASNPCSEYMFVDDSACNLASINLMKFRREDGAFDVERFKAACRVVFIAQEIIVDHASYPTKRIATNSHRFRPIGLGYSNLGSLLMSWGLPYESDQARGICGALTSILHGTACLTSTELAAAVGPFDEFEKNREPMLRVMEMHWEKVEEITSCPKYLFDAAQSLWDAVLTHGKRQGFRNAQATVLAPTGTISFMMDCDTTGIEPDIALVKYKQLAGGGMLKIVNQTVPLALKTLGYDGAQIEAIVAHIDKNDTIEGAAELKPEHLPVFDCAFPPHNGKRSIPWRAHIQMMAAAQPFISGAISKTANMPKNSTPEDIANAYTEGWRLGLKALAIYRDGSKEVQPLSTKSKSDKGLEKPLVGAPRRERLQDTRQSITHKFNVSGHEGYITVGLYPDGRPGELFITMAKEGSTVGGLMDCFGTAVSMSLQYGVPLEVYVNKFSHTRFEPMGFTKNPDIRIAKSIVDYIFRWLGIQFLPGYREANKSLPPGPDEAPHVEHGDTEQEHKPAAMMAGGPSVGQGASKNQSHASSNGSSGSGRGKSNGQNSSGGNGSARRDGAAQSKKTASQPSPLIIMTEPAANPSARDEQFAAFQTDAPTCDNCGAITVRNGNCYLCHNCGNSMGCS